MSDISETDDSPLLYLIFANILLSLWVINFLIYWDDVHPNLYH